MSLLSSFLNMQRSEPLLDASSPGSAFAVLPPRLLLVLLCCYGTFFADYVLVNLLAPFFPTSDAALAIGVPVVGTVIAAFPMGSVLAMPLPPRIIARIGARHTIGLGAAVLSAASLLFAFAPSLLLGRPFALGAALLVCRLLGGAAAALSESAALTLISTTVSTAHLGKALAGVEVVVGIGVASGNAFGGWLFTIGHGTAVGAFAFPFVVCASLQALLLPWLALLPRHSHGSDVNKSTEHEAKGGGSRFQLSDAVTPMSLLLAAAAAEALAPILGPRLQSSHFGIDTAAVGVVFSSWSVAYTISSLPCGYLADRWFTSEQADGSCLRQTSKLKLVMAAGWLCALGSFLLIGRGVNLLPQAAQPLTFVAMSSLGVASALTIVPSNLDMQTGIPKTDEARKASICSMWNGLLSAGTALGPLLSAIAAKFAGFVSVCDAACAVCGVAGAMLGIAVLTAACHRHNLA